MTVDHGDLTIDWYGYATLRIEGPDGTVVYLDPGRYGCLTGEWTPDSEGVGHPPATDYDARDGDVVCVTHDHHYDADGIQRVAGEDVTLVVYDGVDAASTGRGPAPEDMDYDVLRVDDAADLAVGDAVVRTVAAHNRQDGPRASDDGSVPHPEGFGCGFLVTLDGRTVFWPGDTDVLEGHAELDVDVFCPPIGGSFTMDRHEAADLAAEMDPGLVVPIHYNTFAALEADGRAFAGDVAAAGVPVALDER
jgi:L-ascorbate metabolism protein UlaG (beta-lactamase superfamily)